jgi:hypothetical protein
MSDYSSMLISEAKKYTQDIEEPSMAQGANQDHFNIPDERNFSFMNEQPMDIDVPIGLSQVQSQAP